MEPVISEQPRLSTALAVFLNISLTYGILWLKLFLINQRQAADMVLLKNIPIEFSNKDVLRYLGFKPLKSSNSPTIDKLLEETIDLAKLVLTPLAVFETLVLEEINPEKLTFVGTNFFLRGKDIVNFMSSCSKVSLVAATIGAGIEEEISRLFKAQDSSRAVILDAIGSDAVEQVVSWVNTLVQQEARKQGFNTLHRVSPGYSLWSIEANGAIAQALDVKKIGIEVLPSYEMLPRKSVMAAVGWVGK